MSLDELEARITKHISEGPLPQLATSLGSGSDSHKLYVIKYTAPKFLADVLATRSLYASNTPGYTWGDAVYVAPVAYPRSTMMYGPAGVVGWLNAREMKFYDALAPSGIKLYQEWITHYPTLYAQLTTTVHADHANRDLRNAFRTRFEIDCVLFRPDETCVGYADPSTDLWLAVTQWGPSRQVAHGRSQVVRDLKWCAIATEAFEPDGLGYRALLHPTLSRGRTFAKSTYAKLDADIRGAYLSKTETVVITEF